MAGPLNLPSTIKPVYLTENNFDAFDEYEFNTRLCNAILIDLNTALTAKTIIITENIDPLSYILVKVIRNTNGVHIRIIDILGNSIIDPVQTSNFIMIGNPKQDSTEWITYIDANANSNNASGLNLGNGEPVYAGMATDSTGATNILTFRTLEAGTNVTITHDNTFIVINANVPSGLLSTGTNIGVASFGLFAQTAGTVLEFKSLTAGSFIGLVASPTGVQINAVVSGGSGTVTNAANLGIPSFGLFTTNNAGVLEFKSLVAGSSISMSATATGVQINSTTPNATTNAANLGIPSFGLFAQNNNGVLEFKSLTAGSFVTLTANATGVQINTTATNLVTGAANLGIPSFGLFTTNNAGILEFKSLTAGSSIALSATASGVQINSTTPNSVTNATNLGIPSFGLFAQNNNGVLEFKSLTAGSYVSLTANATGVQLNATNVVVSANNLGILSFGLFAQNNNGALEFKSLTAGSFVTLVGTTTGVQINATAGSGGSVNDAANLGIPSFGLFAQKNADILEFKSLTAGSFISMVATATGIQINSASSGSVTGAANLGIPTFGLFTTNNAGILEFKSLTAGTFIALNANATGVQINSTATNLVVGAANLGIPSFGLFTTNDNGTLDFKSLTAGTFITLDASATGVQINTTATNLVVGAANLGIPSFGLFTTNDNGTLDFKSLVGGSSISLTATATGVQINSTTPDAVTNAANLGIPSFGLFAQNNNGVLEFKSLTAGSLVSLSANATGVQINTTNVVIGAANLGVPSFGLFAQNNNGTLEFKSLTAGTFITITANTTGVQINSTATNLVVGAANLGIPSFGLFAQNNNGTLEFKSLTAGSNITLTANTTGVSISSTSPADSYLVSYFPLIENSTINFAAIDVLSVDNNQLKAYPILYDSLIKGLYLYTYNPSAIQISTNQTCTFQFGTIDRGQALLAANFAPIGPSPLIVLDTTTDNNTYISRTITGLNIPLPATKLLAVQINTPGEFHSNTTSSRYIMSVYLSS